MPKGSRYAKPLMKRDIEAAIEKTSSAAETARYLNVSYVTYKKYANLYGLLRTNKPGVGIVKVRRTGATGINDILSGNKPNYNRKKLKDRILHAGILPNYCSLCGFDKARPDGKVPLSLYPLDGDFHNLKIENLEMRCYNCAFLTSGKIDPRLFGEIGEKDEFVSNLTFDQDVNELIGEENPDFESLQNEAMEEMEKNNDS